MLLSDTTFFFSLIQLWYSSEPESQWFAGFHFSTLKQLAEKAKNDANTFLRSSQYSGEADILNAA